MRTVDDFPFAEVWAVDFEFTAPAGDRPEPIRLVAHEMKSGRIVRLFGDDLVHAELPYDRSNDSLFVAYYASAEVHLVGSGD